MKDGSAATIMARLDAYLPTLNTGMMDVRVQDAILNYPIVRSLLVPECDLEARRRCINLVSKVLNAATPVLPLILQDQAKSIKARNPGAKQTIPVLSQEAQSKVMSIISTMAERDRLIRYWMNHHLANRGKTTAATTMTSGGEQRQQQVHPTVELYIRIKQYREILSDLADRVQGAICMVFWECWDEIYLAVADIVGGDEMQQADSGRIFRPSGDAALYINRLKLEKKQLRERERRESIMQTQQHHQPQQMLNHFASPQNPQYWDALLDTTSSSPSMSISSDSPSSLITDASSSWRSNSTSLNFHAQADGSQSGDMMVDADEFLTDDIYSDKLTKDSLDTYTNLGSLEPQQVTSPPEHMDLRKRIQMMEDGFMEDKLQSSVGVHW